MYCPNCGTGNDEGVRFCSNCGTPLDAAAGTPPPPPRQPIQPQVVPPYQSVPPQPRTRDSFLKFLGMGCLVLLALVVFAGLSCTRSCLFGRRRMRYRRY